MFKKRMMALFMAALLLFVAVGCSGGGNSESTEEAGAAKEPIQIATKPMTEQFILGEMLKALIEGNSDYTCEITKGIGGGTSNIHPAMEKGEFDLYPEYTSSGWAIVLKHDGKEVSDDEMFEKLNEEYNEKYDMSWIGLYGFNNTYALVARKATAEEYNFKTTSEMAAVSENLIFGANPDYIEREDGYGILKDTYNLNFKEVKDIDIGLKYQAVESGDIDITNGYTTDAQLSRDDVVVLEDDKNLQLNYFCSTIVRNDALEEYPGLEDILMKMDGVLTDKEMATLNYKVEVDGENEADVARAFLVEKGLIEE